MSSSTHPSWCEADLCAPIYSDDPNSQLLHSGAVVIFDVGPGGSVDVRLLKTAGEATRVSIDGQNMSPAEARRLADLLDRMADLAVS